MQYFGKQPLTQRQQNKGDDRGLQETAEGAPPHPHRSDSSGEGGKILIPRHTHHRQTEMVHPHRQSGEEGATAPLQPQEAEEIWLVTKSTHKLLQMHNREHPGGLYHRLVRQLLRPQP